MYWCILVHERQTSRSPWMHAAVGYAFDSKQWAQLTCWNGREHAAQLHNRPCSYFVPYHIFIPWQCGQHINWNDLEHDTHLVNCPSADIFGFVQVLLEEQWGQNTCCNRTEQTTQLKIKPCLYLLLFHVLFLPQAGQTSVVVIIQSNLEKSSIICSLTDKRFIDWFSLCYCQDMVFFLIDFRKSQY